MSDSLEGMLFLCACGAVPPRWELVALGQTSEEVKLAQGTKLLAICCACGEHAMEVTFVAHHDGGSRVDLSEVQ